MAAAGAGRWPRQRPRRRPSLRCLSGLASLGLLLACHGLPQPAAPPAAPLVEIEEEIYSFVPAQNGADPLWAYGSACLVRSGERLFASGLETLPETPPLNNCRWLLFERTTNGWRQVRHAGTDLTREPSPLAVFPETSHAPGRLFLSSHPTLQPGQYAGAARSEVLEFALARPGDPPQTHAPDWTPQARLTEHSYRSFAADGPRQELILFVNTGYSGAYWTFMGQDGQWSTARELRWPWGATYARPEPVRICYPNVMLRNRTLHFCGVSDIIEPNPEWRAFKRELTGREWDYDFRRLFYIRSPDIRQGEFGPWIEIASREETCGWISPGDLWVDDTDTVHLVWAERALDERLRERFFPTARQSHAIRYARLRHDQVLLRQTLALAEEGGSQEIPSAPRFHITPDHRLFVLYYVSGTDSAGRAVSENRWLALAPDGRPSPPVKVPLQQPFPRFFTATPRAGSPLSTTVDLLGTRAGQPHTIRYARLRLP